MGGWVGAWWVAGENGINANSVWKLRLRLAKTTITKPKFLEKNNTRG